MGEEELADTISFLLNNLTADNLTEQARTLKNLAANFDESTEKWLALFLIRRRISVESNHIPLYVQLLNNIPSTRFHTFLIRSTINYSQQLIDGAATFQNQNPRDLLRNLGSFLGLLTYGRDIELPMNLMDMGKMLLDAEEEGEEKLERAIPFIVKVLKACKSSTIFKPNHPHLLATFATIKRLYSNENMKTTLCFEIETLFEELRANSPVEEINQELEKFEQNFQFDDNFQQYSLLSPPMPQFAQPMVDSQTLYNTMFNNAAAYYNLQLQQQLALQQQIESQQLTAQPYLHEKFIPVPPPKAEPVPVFNEPSEKDFGSSLSSDDNVVWKFPEHSPPVSTTPYVSRDQKLVWDLIDKLDFSCSPVFQLYNTARGLVVETFFTFLVDVERMLAPILRAICESLTWAAASLIYRDMASIDINNFTEFSKLYKVMFRSLTYSLYYQKNVNVQAYTLLQKSVEDAITRAMKSSTSPRGFVNSEQEWTKKRSSRQFAHANAEVIGIFVCEVLDRFGNELGGVQVQQFLSERVQRPQMIGLGRFCYNPQTLGELNSILPEALRHTGDTMALVRFYTYFVEITSALKRTIISDLKDIDPRVFMDVNEKETTDNQIELKGSTFEFHPEIQHENSAFHVPPPTRFARSSIQSVSDFPKSTLHSVVDQSPDKKQMDPFTKKILVVFREWCVSSRSAEAIKRDCFQRIANYVYNEQLIADEAICSRFFEVCLKVCIDLAEYLEKLNAQNEKDKIMVNRQLFNHVKALALLVDRLAVEELNRGRSRSTLIEYFINVVVKSQLQKFTEWEAPTKLRQSVFLFTYSWLLIVQTRSDAQPYVGEFMNVFVRNIQAVSPQNLPEFAYSYVMLMAHPNFLQSLLANKNIIPQTATPMYMSVIRPMLKYHASLIQNKTDLKHPDVQHLNKGIARLFASLYHDFPIFFIRENQNVLKFLPPMCLHLRNLVLSAEPALPHYLSPNVGYDKCSMVDLMNTNPELHTEYLLSPTEELRRSVGNISEASTESIAEEYVNDLAEKLKKTEEETQQELITRVTNMVLYIGVASMNDIKKSKANISVAVVANNKFVKVLALLLKKVENETIFTILNCIVDQLRFPMSHTNFFVAILLNSFKTGKPEVKEILTRIMFERLITIKPHPFGLQLLWSEFMTNQVYEFQSQDFVQAVSQ